MSASFDDDEPVWKESKGKIELRPGDRVKVIGGKYNIGHGNHVDEATVTKIDKSIPFTLDADEFDEHRIQLHPPEILADFSIFSSPSILQIIGRIGPDGNMYPFHGMNFFMPVTSDYPYVSHVDGSVNNCTDNFILVEGELSPAQKEQFCKRQGVALIDADAEFATYNEKNAGKSSMPTTTRTSSASPVAGSRAMAASLLHSSLSSSSSSSSTSSSHHSSSRKKETSGGSSSIIDTLIDISHDTDDEAEYKDVTAKPTSGYTTTTSPRRRPTLPRSPMKTPVTLFVAIRNQS